MRLLTAHKVLIGAAILLGLFLVPWGVQRYRHEGDVGSLALACAGGAAALALGFYLRYVIKRHCRTLR